MILEGIVTTLGVGDLLNVAPMGPEINASSDMGRFVLRPYRTSKTFVNLKARGEGVLHVTDNVLLLAQAAIGLPLDPFPVTRPAAVVGGAILAECCRYYEFRVVELDDREDRTRIEVETVAEGRLRDFFGFNRAKHAVLEAAILATRIEWLAVRDLLNEFKKLELLVQKTGGASEHAAFRLLHEFLRDAASRQGVDPDLRRSPP